MSEALWALGRGTGIVALVCFTATMVLGIMGRAGRETFGVGRFGLNELHRAVSLTGVGLIAVHVGTLMFDPYAQLKVVDAVVPFVGDYRPVWQGLGTLAVDLLLVVTVVSLLRDKVGPRVFRTVHLLTYLMWPVAMAHALGNGTNNTSAWMIGLAAGCTLAVVGSVVWRLSPAYARSWPDQDRTPRRTAGRHAMTISQAPPTTVRLLGPTPTEPLPRLSLAELVGLAERSGLTGRGGAGFPTARKITAVAGAGSRPVVVGNAMEGEPLSHKDAVLLRVAPGLVLDGLELLAGALGARRTVLAVAHRIDAGPVRAAADGRPVEVRQLDGGFVAGQESALVNRLDGRPGVPSDRLRPVWRSGVERRPTLVANTETLARLALLARHGDAAMPGTRLVSVSGSSRDVVGRAGVVEVTDGITLGELLQHAEVPTPRVRAALVGGYHGTWSTDPSQAVDAGIVHVLDRRDCPLRGERRHRCVPRPRERRPVRPVRQRAAPHGRRARPAGPARARPRTRRAARPDSDGLLVEGTRRLRPP